MLGAKITQLGMDQRKLNMLAREIGPQLGFWKPVVVSHHMLMGLGKPPTDIGNQISAVNGPTTDDRPLKTQSAMTRAIALKMSKSHPDSAIFMTDTTEDIKRKLNKAWCLEGEVKDNPVLEYCKYIIFESVDSMTIVRPEKFGGNLTVTSYEDLENKFAAKEIHPQDLKVSVASELDKLLQPVREHFEKNEEAKKLLERVISFQVTR